MKKEDVVGGGLLWCVVGWCVGGGGWGGGCGKL